MPVMLLGCDFGFHSIRNGFEKLVAEMFGTGLMGLGNTATEDDHKDDRFKNLQSAVDHLWGLKRNKVLHEGKKTLGSRLNSKEIENF